MKSKLRKLWEIGDSLCRNVIQNAGSKKGLKPNEILAICLAIKIQNSCTAILLLLENDFVHDSKILLRTVAEAIILLGSSLDDPDFMEHYHLEGLTRKSLLFKKMLNGKIWNEADLTEEQKSIRDQTNIELSESLNKSTLRKLADKNGFQFEYYGWRSLCT